MKALFLLAGLVGAILAQYGSQAPRYPPVPVPSGQVPIIPWYPHYYHSSSSESSSRSDSRERKRKCAGCRKLKKLRDSSISTLVSPKIKYIHDRKDCIRAVIRCPFDNGNYTLYVGNDINDSEALSTGSFIERTVKCNRKGRWETEDDYRFKYVGCQNNGVSITTPAPTPTSAPAGCTSCDPSAIELLPGSQESGHAPTTETLDPQNGCSAMNIVCTPEEGKETSALTFQTGIGGPAAGDGGQTIAPVVCNDSGQWIFTQGEDSLEITQAFCIDY